MVKIIWTLFFKPAAKFLEKQATLDSVHVYPFLFIAQKSGSAFPPSNTDIAKPILFSDPSDTVVSDFEELWRLVPSHRGKSIVLKNHSWGSLHTAQRMTDVFAHFNALHWASIVLDPPECYKTDETKEMLPICKATNNLNEVQTKITGIHIYADMLIVDVSPESPPVSLFEERRGKDWLPY